MRYGGLPATSTAGIGLSQDQLELARQAQKQRGRENRLSWIMGIGNLGLSAADLGLQQYQAAKRRQWGTKERLGAQQFEAGERLGREAHGEKMARMRPELAAQEETLVGKARLGLRPQVRAEDVEDILAYGGAGRQVAAEDIRTLDPLKLASTLREARGLGKIGLEQLVKQRQAIDPMDILKEVGLAQQLGDIDIGQQLSLQERLSPILEARERAAADIRTRAALEQLKGELPLTEPRWKAQMEQRDRELEADRRGIYRAQFGELPSNLEAYYAAQNELMENPASIFARAVLAEAAGEGVSAESAIFKRRRELGRTEDWAGLPGKLARLEKPEDIASQVYETYGPTLFSGSDIDQIAAAQQLAEALSTANRKMPESVNYTAGIPQSTAFWPVSEQDRMASVAAANKTRATNELLRLLRNRMQAGVPRPETPGPPVPTMQGLEQPPPWLIEMLRNTMR